MAQRTSADDDAQNGTALDALEPGATLELTYDGCRGSRTVWGYIAAVETTPAILDRSDTKYEVRIGTPEDHTPRFLRLSFTTTEDDENRGTYALAEDYVNVYSMNSQSDRGQRLGHIEDITFLDAVDDRGVQVANLRASGMGDRVRVGDRQATVLDPDGYGATVEFENGDRETIHYTADRGVYYSVIDADDDYSKTVHSVEFAPVEDDEGETVEETPSEEVADLWEDLNARVFDDEDDSGRVVAVDIAGDRHRVVYRTTDDCPHVRLQSPGYDEGCPRNYDTHLTLEPTGLRLSPVYRRDGDARSLDPSEITLVYEGDLRTTGDDDEDEDEGEPELVTDGGQDLPTVEFRNRRPDHPNELRGLGPEVQVGEVWVSCNVCGYYGLVPRSTIPVEGVRCEECLSASSDDAQEHEQEPEQDRELVTDGGEPVEDEDDLHGQRVYVPSRGEGTVVENSNHAGQVGVKFDDRLGETTTYVEREDLFVRLGEADDEEDEPELVTDGGEPVEEDTPEPADAAKLLRVRGEATGVSTLSVYYEAAGETFRARLRPVRPLPEEDHIRDREALVLSDLSTVEDVGGPGVEWFDTTHVPAVVRRAVDRPVQVPARGH